MYVACRDGARDEKGPLVETGRHVSAVTYGAFDVDL